MFKNLKSKMIQKFVQSKLPKDLPKEQQDKIAAAVSENPELFQEIGKEIQRKMKEEGKDQMTAAMEVMQKHKGALNDLMH